MMVEWSRCNNVLKFFPHLPPPNKNFCLGKLSKFHVCFGFLVTLLTLDFPSESSNQITLQLKAKALARRAKRIIIVLWFYISWLKPERVYTCNRNIKHILTRCCEKKLHFQVTSKAIAGQNLRRQEHDTAPVSCLTAAPQSLTCWEDRDWAAGQWHRIWLSWKCPKRGHGAEQQPPGFPMRLKSCALSTLTPHRCPADWTVFKTLITLIFFN